MPTGAFVTTTVLGDWGTSPYVAVILAFVISLLLYMRADKPEYTDSSKKWGDAICIVLLSTITLGAAAFGIGPAAEEAADEVW